MTYTVKHISISIDKSADEVYQFASNVENFPAWVEFIKSVSKESADVWVAETDAGNIKIKFSSSNEFGILDHAVTTQDGTVVSNPMRVVSNHDGSELIFTLFRMPGRTDEEFTKDAKAVEADLGKIKSIVETRS